MHLKYGINRIILILILILCFSDQENEEVKRLFEDIPDEDRADIKKLSFKLAALADDKSKL